jgi:hypothetical protein
MTDANEILIEALLDDVLDEGIVNDSVDEALRLPGRRPKRPTLNGGAT